MALPQDEQSLKKDKSLVQSCLEMLEDNIASDVTFVIETGTPNGDMKYVPAAKKLKVDPGECVSKCDADETKTKEDTKQRSGTEELTNGIEVQDDQCNDDENNGSPVLAHKFMLIARSSVFRALFTGPLATVNDVIHIRDCHSVDAFKQMLRYIYSERTQMSSSTVMSVLYLARKYRLAGLVTECVRFAKHCVSPSCVLEILRDAFKRGEMDIVQACLTLVERKTEFVIRSENIFDVSKDILDLILMVDTLSVPEEQLCEACFAWANHQCGKATKPPPKEQICAALGQSLYKLQFQNLGAKAFTKLVVKKGILPQEVAFRFYRCILSDDDEKEAIPEGFSSGRVTRIPRTLRPACALRKGQVNENFLFQHDIENLHLSSTKPIRICSLTFLILLNPAVNAEAEICHLSDDRDTVVVNGGACCQSIKYITSKDTPDQAKFFQLNGQLVMFVLFPAMEVGGVCDMAIHLRSRVEIRLLPAEVDTLSDEHVTLNVKRDGTQGLPLYDVSYTLCDG